MDDTHLYCIRLAGLVSESDLLAFSPAGARVELEGESGSRLTIRTDQSGLVGFIRQLHGLGFVLLAFDTLTS